ncbi:MAG TPA: EAL domain-containing protein [Burkholderiales bacterium]|nr:EAL domain-containing protein [Burkholderiales bacterium]
MLLTEDVASDAELELRELKRAGLRVKHRLVDTEQSFEQALREFAPDVILSDFSMPGFDGMAALAMARELSPDTPFIFVSGTIGEEYAIRALKSGATDYVLKSNLLRLPAAVERALAEAQERRDRRKVEAELEIAQGRLASIIDSLPDVLWSTALPERSIIYVGPASRQMFGREPDDFLADPKLWLEIVDPQDRPPLVEAWRRLLAEGGVFDIDYRIQRPEGTVRWVNSRAHLVRGAGGEERVDGVTRDITEQVEHRARIERLSRIRELLGTLNSAIVRVRERDLLFDEFCRIAVSHGGFVLARIVEVDRHGKASLAATTEADPTLFRRMIDDYNRDPAASESLFAKALHTGESMISNDLADDARVSMHQRAALTREGNYSLALLPLKVDGRLAGLVALRAREPGFFDHDELRLLSEMVSNISFALELMDKQDRISYLALYDPLTGLPNRKLFHQRLTQALEGARRSRGTVALALIDLERFKAINDTLGQQVGDRVLQAVGKRLQEAAGDIHRVARLGANLFALMFQEIGEAEEVARLIEAGSRTLFSAPFTVEGREVPLAAKAGIAVFPDDGADADALLRNAEAALKRAKETGERYLFYAPEINARVSEQVELEHRLRKAVEQGELFLHYQPKFDLATRKIVGVEALMRWRSPDGGLVSPAKFVPVLEQTGLIFEAGQQVLAAAQRTHAGWKARGLNAPRIAVNVSALQLRRKSFVADVRAALGNMETDGGGVDLEVTESLLMTEVDESIAKLRELRQLGLHISLDDFGTGYSSLAYLSKLPLDALKIDRSFVHGMTEKADDTSIISTIISLAQSLRLKVIAEGVETEQQAQLLRLLRCDQVQGYLFSPPVPAEKIETLL